MEYVLMNGDYYCYLTETAAIKKTTDIEMATKFKSPQAAHNLKERACAKLKNYHVLEVETSNLIATSSKRRNFSINKRVQIYNKNQGRCAICGRFIPFDEFTVDHIIPLAKGGTNSDNNLQCACKTCNMLKQDILPEDLMDKITEIILYQMEQNNNEELFEKIVERVIKKYSKIELLKRIIK